MSCGSKEQESQYGCFTDNPTSEQLAKYFWLDDKDKELVWRHRGEHNQLGFAVQLGTVRFLGTFLSTPTDVPQAVVEYIADQLSLNVCSFVYYQSNRSQWDHMNEIRFIYGYSNFTDQPGHWRLVRWLYTRAWLYSERPSVLFDLATARCIEQKILFPGVSVLTKLVAKVRERALENLWRKLAGFPNSNQRKLLENLLQARNFIKQHGGSTKKAWKNAPITGINASWSKIVIDKHRESVNPRAYTFWVLEQVLEALRRHDLYIIGSEKYGDLRSQLLQGEEWKTIRPQILRSLDWSLDSQQSLAPLKKELDTLYHQTIENWDNNPAVRIETFAGKQRIVLTPLQKLEEPKSLRILRKRVLHILPSTDLPQLLLEVHRCTGFMDAFRHISEARSRINDLPISICALLISQACNIGLRPVVQDGIPSLECDRLTWIEQNYFRAETITEANERLVDFHSQLKLANVWGGGEIASADGLRFFTPVRSVHSGLNPKYFGTGRGVTYYNFTSDQFTGLHGLVIPGTIHDSLYLLQCVLEQDTSLQPKEIMTDTAGYSDIIFGLFGLLGYQFSPRLADVGESRLWRFDVSSDYGILNQLSKNRIREDLIHRHWEDMLRVAGSLKLNKVMLLTLFKHYSKTESLLC